MAAARARGSCPVASALSLASRSGDTLAGDAAGAEDALALLESLAVAGPASARGCDGSASSVSVASVAELTFPVVAIAVGYLAFDATLTNSQLAGVVLTSLVVLGLPARAPALVAGPRVTPAVADSAA